MDHYNIAIIGGGLAGLLRADTLSESLDPSLRVVIIDSTPTSLNEKTFAYWRKKSEVPHRYSQLVSNRWEKFKITDTHNSVTEKSFEDYCYERISGEHLLQHLNQKIDQDPRFTRICSGAKIISELNHPEGGNRFARIDLESGQQIAASRVFSSPTDPSSGVHQSFLGFEIQTSGDHFNPETIDLMDFFIEQGRDVRFVYILPFSARHALIEFTLFSEDELNAKKYEPILREYLSDRLKLTSYTVMKVESGTIPMSVDHQALFPPLFQGSVIEVIGGAAGMIKPSTGYSFKKNLETQTKPPSSRYCDFRFRVYDSILLGMIRRNGASISKIFPHLFKNNSANQIFSFLDEETQLYDELKIFYSLPWWPFIRELVALYPFVFAVAITLILHHTIGGIAVWVVPLLGFLTVGIGHGSLDHLIDPRAQSKPSFYVRYLLFMSAFALVWYALPSLALVFFIFQSADHFGESYWISSLLSSRNSVQVRAMARIWGLFAALFGVLFHWTESLPLIQEIFGRYLPLETLSIEGARSAGIVLFILAAAASTLLDNYKTRVTARPVNGMPATLLLGLTLMMLPLLPGFFCFFSFWHSWDSMMVQRQSQKWTASDYARKALPYTLMTYAGLTLAFLISTRLSDLSRIWPIVFVGIGALTNAHAPVMKRFLLLPKETLQRASAG